MDHFTLRLRVQRTACHLCGLGPRAVAELLLDVISHTSDAPYVLDRLDFYDRLSRAHVQAVGADRMPPRPLRQVPL